MCNRCDVDVYFKDGEAYIATRDLTLWVPNPVECKKDDIMLVIKSVARLPKYLDRDTDVFLVLYKENLYETNLNNDWAPVDH